MAYKDEVPYMVGKHSCQVIHVIHEPGLRFQEIYFIIPAYFHVYSTYLAYTVLFVVFTFCVYNLCFSHLKTILLSLKTMSNLSMYSAPLPAQALTVFLTQGCDWKCYFIQLS